MLSQRAYDDIEMTLYKRRQLGCFLVKVTQLSVFSEEKEFKAVRRTGRNSRAERFSTTEERQVFTMHSHLSSPEVIV